MFILDSLLVGGLRFVLEKLASAAEAEASDARSLRERLLEAQMQLELGDISEEDFASIERDLLARIRQMKGSRADTITMTGTARVTGVDVESYDEKIDG
jgi:Gas vesicle protein G